MYAFVKIKEKGKSYLTFSFGTPEKIKQIKCFFINGKYISPEEIEILHVKKEMYSHKEASYISRTYAKRYNCEYQFL